MAPASLTLTFSATQTLAMIILITTIIAATTTTTVSGMFDYAVQVQPVIFIKEPQSQLTTEGQSLTLSCQIRLAPLVSYQPLPSIVWLKDDIIVTVEDSSMTISNNVSDGFSELIIPVINTSLSGSYQCLANDADERYSTISKKATITILAKANPILITVQLGQPLLLNCSPVFGYENIWRHNNTVVVNETILSTGSLFIPNATYNHQGVWQCHTSYSIDIISSSSSSSSSPFSDSNYIPFAFLDTVHSGHILLGDSLDLHCQIVGISSQLNATVTWHQVTTNQTLLLQIYEFNGNSNIDSMMIFSYAIGKFKEDNIGYYYCSFELILNNETVTIVSFGLDLIVTGSPMIKTTPKVIDKFLDFDATLLELSCAYTSDIPAEIYWTKNGKYINVTNEYDINTGQLLISKPVNVEELFGTYQCFVENKYGIDYTVNRILVKYLSNPPGNLDIKARTNVSNFFLPYLDISWTPPIQRGSIEELSYSVTVGDVLAIASPTIKFTDPSSITNSTVIELSVDSTYIVVISVYRPNIQGLQTKCIIDTAERFYTINKPFDYLFCTDDGRVSIKWTPLGSNPLLYPTESVTIKGTCVYNGTITEFQSSIDSLDSQYKAEPFSELPPGTVCELHGQYRYGFIPYLLCNNDVLDFVKLSQTYYEIPRKVCQIQDDSSLSASKDAVNLSLACGADMLQISWNISIDLLCELTGSASNAINISGVCVHKHETFEFNHTIDLMSVLPEGFLTYDNISANSICSFGVNSSDVKYVISPAQCVLGSLNPNKLGYSSIVQNQSIDCINHFITSSAMLNSSYSASETTGVSTRDIIINESDGGNAVIVGAIVAVCSMLLVACTVFFCVVTLFLFKRYKRTVNRSWSLNEFEIQEKIESVVNEEVCSIKTVVGSLYHEENIGFNIYKGYTIEDPNSKPDTTGSSGYGSEVTAGSCDADYRSHKLNEVEYMNNLQTESSVTDASPGNDHFPGLKDNVIMCVYCSRIHLKRIGSVNDLNRLCPCVGNEGYVRLAGPNKDHRDNCLSSREWLNARLSTLSV